MNSAWIGLGANLGDPPRTLARALQMLDESDSVRVCKVSSAYRSAPWGRTDQPEFVNAVARIETSLFARQLLNGLLEVENLLGRKRTDERWGPRLIDLDLLLYDQEIIDEPELHVPHPRLAERAFVLVPMAELAPELEIPGMGRVDELLAALDDRQRDSVGPGSPLPRPPLGENRGHR